jgi:transposase
MSDYKGAAKMINAFPKAKALLAEKGYDADWFRDALAERKITACIPSRANPKVSIRPRFSYCELVAFDIYASPLWTTWYSKVDGNPIRVPSPGQRLKEFTHPHDVRA